MYQPSKCPEKAVFADFTETATSTPLITAAPAALRVTTGCNVEAIGDLRGAAVPASRSTTQRPSSPAIPKITTRAMQLFLLLGLLVKILPSLNLLDTYPCAIALSRAGRIATYQHRSQDWFREFCAQRSALSLYRRASPSSLRTVCPPSCCRPSFRCTQLFCRTGQARSWLRRRSKDTNPGSKD